MRIENTLDRGSTAKVKKIRYKGRVCAMKVIPFHKRGEKEIAKEILIHASLDHPFILRLLDQYTEDGNHCVVLEYEPYSLRALIEQSTQNTGGIHPDVVHLIFSQLIAAVKYIHGRNVCHRDIKPENILISYNGNIKVTDFGASTLFFCKRQRRLKSRVGSLEFMAPEMFQGSYDGELADIWACGITLLNMLAGALPWQQAVPDDEKYSAYCALDYHYYDPFKRLPGPALSLVKGMLCEESRRFRIRDIETHPWFKRCNKFIGADGRCINSGYLKNILELGSELYFTQPNEVRKGECFIRNSLPVSSSGNVPMHRLYLQGGTSSNIQEIQSILERMAVACRTTAESIVFSTTDTRRNRLSGEIILQGLGDNCIAIISKTSGDLFEFQKFVMYVDRHFS